MKYISFFLFLISLNIARSQDQIAIYIDPFTGGYMPFGLGSNYSIVKDDALSPMSYSGILGQMEAGFIYQNNKWISNFMVNGSGGFQKPDVNRKDHPSQALSISSKAYYSLSYKAFSVQGWHFFGGLNSLNSWDFRGNERYSNSYFNFAGIFSLGPIFTAQKHLKVFNKDWGVQYELTIPVAAYALRPSYIKPYFADKLGFRDFVFWGDYFQLDCKAQLVYFLSNRNQIRLGYTWEYAQINIPNKVQQARHALVVSTLFNF